jgi:MFS family permease
MQALSQAVQAARNGFYGWRIVAASFVILFVAVGVGLYVPPVFLVPLEKEFGWGRAQIATGSSIAAMVSALLSPVAGACIDRYGARTVMTFGGLIMGVAFALFGQVQSLWHLYAINVIGAVGITCAAWIPNQTLVSNWFEKKRGMAMGLALTGIGFGGLMMAPFADFLIEAVGWRYAFAGLGAVVAVVVTVTVLAVVQSRPADLGLRADGESVGVAEAAARVRELDGIGLSEALRSSSFWVLSVCNFLLVFASMSLIVHVVAFLRDVGFDSRAAAGTLGSAVGVSVAGRLFFGLLSDRFDKRTIMSFGLMVYAAAAMVLFRVESAGILPVFIVLFGIALGGTAVLTPLLVGEFFGLRAFGQILGLLMISGTIGAAIGPVVTGRIYDVTGSYETAFWMHAASFTAAAVGVRFAAHPR